MTERVVSLAWDRLQGSPSELAFQLIGRLTSLGYNLPEVRDFVKLAIESTKRPWLKPEQQCPSGPDSTILQLMPVGRYIENLFVDKVAR